MWLGVEHRRPLNQVAVEIDAEIFRRLFTVANYPNPATLLRLSNSLCRDRQVTLEVYDIVGRLVRTLVASTMTAKDRA
jgi:hypothetical protein